MRKVIMAIAFVSFVLLSASLLIRVFANAVELIQPASPWVLNVWLIIAGFILMVAAMVLYVIYCYRQERAREQQFKKWGLIVRTNENVLRCKSEKAKPYKREVWLLLAFFGGLGFSMICPHVMELILPQILPPPSVGSTPQYYMKLLQDYKENFARIDLTLSLLFWLVAPVSLLICTFLSRDLAKKSDNAAVDDGLTAYAANPPSTTNDLQSTERNPE